MRIIENLDSIPSDCITWMEDWCFVYFEDKYCVVKYWSESQKIEVYVIFYENTKRLWYKLWLVKEISWVQSQVALPYKVNCITIIKDTIKKDMVTKPKNFKDECVER